jgi:hypothetical protein
MPVLDHAFGERYDSPVPVLLFALGGAAVVLASFALVRSRAVPLRHAYTSDDDVRPRPASAAARTASIAALALLIAIGLVGSQEVARNLLPVWFWLVIWVVVPLLVGLFGDFTARFNPFAAIAQAADDARLRRLLLGGPALRWPAGLGRWPFAAGYALIVIGELVVNETATLPRVTAVCLALYAVICAAGGLVFGADAWNRRAEVFTVLFATWGRLGRRRHGAPGEAGLGGGLVVPFEPTASRLVGVLLLLVSVAFDGLLATPQWGRLLAALPTTLSTGAGYTGFAVACFAAITVVMLLVFGQFARASARAGGHRDRRLVAALTGLAPSLLPISYGYLLAHYLQYVLINGQLLAPLIGNPVGASWWPIHLPYPFNDTFDPDPRVMPTSVIWYLQIVVIVAAHVLAVVLAHRHLAREASSPAQAQRSEWPWLVAMVGYTMLSLWLLAQPLIAEH